MRRGQTVERLNRPGIRAAVVAIAAAGVLAGVGVAGASSAAEHELHAPLEPVWEPSNDLTVRTGDTVRWTFDPNGFHNVESTSANWSIDNGPPDINQEPVSYTFTTAGTYTFTCEIHQGAMDGTVTVSDTAPTPTPTETGTPTAIPTSTSTPPPQPTSSATPPTGDVAAPAVSSVRLTALRRGARVRFAVSEPSTVTLHLLRRGSARVLKTLRVQARGTKTVTIRSRKLKKGRYTVRLSARDAFGNTSATLNRRLTIKR